MKKTQLTAIIIIIMTVLSTVSYAETKLDINGQVRVRNEASLKNFNSAYDHYQSFHLLRTRLNVKAVVDENALAFIQFQDSRTLGGLDQFGARQSSGLNDGKNVDIHQAYIKYNLWTKPGWSIGAKAGRFEFNWGDQRLLGAVGWHNVGRVWEGGLAWYKNDNFKIGLASLKVQEVNNPGYNEDVDAFALFAKFNTINLDLLLFGEIDGDTVGLGNDIKMLNRVTMAAYYEKKMNQLDIAFNIALQGGTTANLPAAFNPLTDTVTSEIDIAAFLFTGEIGYSFNGDKKGRIAAAIDFASGDDFSDSTKTKTFNNLYWTGHKFNGFMDYFLGGGPNGLVDIILKGKIEIIKGWTAGADLHIFSAAEEYLVDIDPTPANNFVSTKDVGTELDITIKTNRVKGIALQFGASFFSAKDNFAIYQNGAFDKQSGTWLYSQGTISF